MLARAFWWYPSIIVADVMNICKLTVRPADAKIKSKTEERNGTKHKVAKAAVLRKRNRCGNGPLKMLKSLYLGA